MAATHPGEPAPGLRPAIGARLAVSWSQALGMKPRPPNRLQTLLQEEINAWVNEGGHGDDEGP